MSTLIIHSDLIIIPALAVLLSRFPKLWFCGDSRLRPVIHTLAWVIALCIAVLTSFSSPINDDEVFYMTQAYARQIGEVSGVLPMRMWIFYPCLALGLSPASTLLAGRIMMFLGVLLAGVIVMSVARKIDRTLFTGSMVGAISIITFANLPTGTFVPENIAFLFLLFAVWSVMAAPPWWSRAFSVFVYGLMLALASLTSLRYPLFSVAGLFILFLEPGKLTRVGAIIWASIGMLAGLLPTAVYIATKESVASLMYWNYTLPRRAEFIEFNGSIVLPAVVAAMAMLGCCFLWNARQSLDGSRTLMLLWITATLAAILNPQKHEYTLAPWLALSFIVATAAMSGLPSRMPGSAGRRVYVFALCLLFFGQMSQSTSMLANPALIREGFRKMDSGLRLINWLEAVVNGNPVACVAPYHPVRAPNIWRMWNVNYYCYITDPQLNAELDPDLEARLLSKRAAVIQWDPWPGESEQANILKYLVSRKFVPEERISRMAEELRNSYKLVQWVLPLTEEFGGGRFLVRREINVGDKVRLLEDSLIAPEK